MLSNIDFVRNNWDSVGAFLNSGWGTFTSFVVGMAILGYSIHRGLRTGNISLDSTLAEPIVQGNQLATPPSLQKGLYVCDIRFTFADLQSDRHSELTMRVFNASGRVVAISGLSGHIKFNAPNNVDPSRMGVLPTPAMHPDTERTVTQLREWLLILTQRVPAAEADKLVEMLEADVPILFDLSELIIEVSAQDGASKAERLPIWSGVSYSRGHGFGMIISGIMEVKI